MKRAVAVFCRRDLARVGNQRSSGGRSLRVGNIHCRQQQRVQKLLLNHLQWYTEAMGNLHRRKSIAHMEISGYRTRQNELTRKEIHPDLPALSRAIVEHFFDANRRVFDGPVRFNLHCYNVLCGTLQNDMPEFMGN